MVRLLRFDCFDVAFLQLQFAGIALFDCCTCSLRFLASIHELFCRCFDSALRLRLINGASIAIALVPQQQLLQLLASIASVAFALIMIALIL
jgi:hypothetical protein